MCITSAVWTGYQNIKFIIDILYYFMNKYWNIPINILYTKNYKLYSTQQNTIDLVTRNTQTSFTVISLVN